MELLLNNNDGIIFYYQQVAGVSLAFLALLYSIIMELLLYSITTKLCSNILLKKGTLTQWKISQLNTNFQMPIMPWYWLQIPMQLIAKKPNCVEQDTHN